MSKPHAGPLLVAAALSLWARAPQAAPSGAPDKQTCIEAHAASQELRQNNKLRETRDQLQICANASCPQLARADCVKWLAEVERDLPTVVLSARGEGGKALEGLRVVLDGSPLEEGLDGAPVGVDPGPHIFRFEAQGAKSVEQRITLKAGDKGKAVSASLPEAAPAPAAVKAPADGGVSAGPPVGALVLGGVGVLGLGAFAYFGLTGQAGESDLKVCKPRCAQGDVDTVKTKYIVADVGLGIGVVSLGVAAYLLLSRPAAPTGASIEGRPRADRPRLWLDAAAGPSGGSAWLSGSF